MIMAACMAVLLGACWPWVTGAWLWVLFGLLVCWGLKRGHGWLMVLAIASALWQWWGLWQWQLHVKRALTSSRSVVGYVSSLPLRHGPCLGVRLEIDRPHALRGWSLRWSHCHGALRPQLGESWSVSGAMVPLSMKYPSQRWLAVGRKEVAQLRTDDHHPPKRLSPVASWHGILRARQRLWDTIAVLPSSSHWRGVLAALILGDHRLMRRQDYQLFTSTGTGHLLAVSGLHVGLVYGGVDRLGRWLWSCLMLLRRRCVRYGPVLCQGLAWTVMTVFCDVAGWSLSAQRAWLMLSMYVGHRLGLWCLRGEDMLVIAAAFMVIAEPWCVMQASFWLSYLAVWILIATHRTEPHLRLSSLLAIQWRMTLGMACWSVMFFHRLALYSLIANTFAIAGFSWVVVPLALVGALCLWLHAPWAYVLWAWAESGESYLAWAIHAISQWPVAILTAKSLPTWVLCMGVVAGFILTLPLGPAKRYFWVWLVAVMSYFR